MGEDFIKGNEKKSLEATYSRVLKRLAAKRKIDEENEPDLKKLADKSRSKFSLGDKHLQMKITRTLTIIRRLPKPTKQHVEDYPELISGGMVHVDNWKDANLVFDMELEGKLDDVNVKYGMK